MDIRGEGLLRWALEAACGDDLRRLSAERGCPHSPTFPPPPLPLSSLSFAQVAPPEQPHRLVPAPMSDVPKLSITLLGAGQEVGRSCCVLQYRGRTIVCDAGVHPAYSGIASLPFVDDLDWSTVDVLLVTQ